jgi:hypothetical protein
VQRVVQIGKSPANPYAARTVGGEGGFEPTVRITAQRFSSSKILMFDPAIQCENVSPGLAFLVPRRGLMPGN